jgi:ubiquinone/menaquinone biosynthesis C-methylase UbiE
LGFIKKSFNVEPVLVIWLLKRVDELIFVAETSDVLDVGCGNVPTTSIWSHTKRGTIGIDIRRGKADIIADAQALPIRDNAFEKVVSFFVIEHVLHIETMVREMIRVSKNEVIIGTDNALFYRVPLMRLLGSKTAYLQEEHVYAFFPFQMEHFLERTGIKQMVKKCTVKICDITPRHKLDKIMVALSRLIPNSKPLVHADILVHIIK